MTNKPEVKKEEPEVKVEEAVKPPKPATPKPSF